MAVSTEVEGLGALESVLAMQLNDIPDLPDYKNPPAGTYAMLVESIKQKEINDKTALSITYVIDTVIELSDPDLEDQWKVIPGNKWNESFYFDKPENIEGTLGALKKKFAALAEPLGTTNLAEILKGMVGMKINCTVTNRVNKSVTPHSIYSSTRDVTLAAA